MRMRARGVPRAAAAAAPPTPPFLCYLPVLLVVLSLPAASSDLVVAGYFTAAGGSSALNIAQWNGTAWSALGAGCSADPMGLTVYQGELVAGGYFSRAGGSLVNYVARWNGTAWAALAAGVNAQVNALTVYRGLLVAGGAFTAASGVRDNVSYVAQWNGARWAPLGDGVDATVYALALYDRSLVAGGAFTKAGGATASCIAQWDGASWSPLGPGVSSTVLALTVYNGHLVAGGSFYDAGDVVAPSVALWDGTAWSALGSGFDHVVRALAVYRGSLVAGGWFRKAGNLTVSYIAQWNGASWSGLRTGMEDHVNALTVHNGSLVAGGWFTAAGGTNAYYVAQWNATAWSRIGSGTNNVVYALTVYDDDQCSLAASEWAAQPYTVEGIVVEGGLVFTQGGTFAQNTTAVPFQPCPSNWIDWSGGYEQVNATAVVLTYTRCTQSDPGCLSCEPAHTERMGVSFSEDCATVTLTPEAGEARTYVACATGWAAPNCSDCASGYYGPVCAPCSQCGARGTCLGGVGGRCVCDPGWVGETCTACDDGSYGEDCAPCAVCEMHGTCEPGLGGRCVCDLGWTGEACDACAPGWAAPTCSDCASGYYGPTCAPCGNCSAHGICQGGVDGRCLCDSGWAGETCGECDDVSYGADCAPCAACTAHGVCEPGLDGRCLCDLGWAGAACDVCAPGWAGAGCSECDNTFYGPTCAPCESCEYHGVCQPGRSGVCTCDAGWAGPACTDCPDPDSSCSPTAPVWLYAGGPFKAIDSVAAQGVAWWDGAVWQSMGAGISRSDESTAAVHAIETVGDDVYVGGMFDTAGSVRANNVARWDGRAWYALDGLNGAGPIAGTVHALAVVNGAVIVGGDFMSRNGRNLAAWQEGAWSSIGDVEDAVYALLSAPSDGTCGLYVAGLIWWVDGQVLRGIAHWNGGGRWSPLGEGLAGAVWSLAAYDGAILAGGSLDPTRYQGGLASWDGDRWQSLGAPGFGKIVGIQAVGHVLFVVDDASNARRLYKHYRGTWQAMNPAPYNDVNALASNGDGYGLLVATDGHQGSVLDSPVLGWNGTVWRPFVTSVASSTVVTALRLNTTAAASAGGECKPGTSLSTTEVVIIAVVVPVGVMMALAGGYALKRRRAAAPPRPSPTSPIGQKCRWLPDASALFGAQPAVRAGAVHKAWAFARAGHVQSALAELDGAVASDAAPAALAQALLCASKADMHWVADDFDAAMALYSHAQPVLQSDPLTASVAALVNMRMAYMLWRRGQAALAVPLLRAALDARGEDWFVETAGGPFMQFILTVLPPPQGGWRKATLEPSVVSASALDADPTHALRAARSVPGVKVVREWCIARADRPSLPNRIVVAEARRISVWIESATTVPVLVLSGVQCETEMPFTFGDASYVLQRDNVGSLRGMLGGTRHRLYCNGRACDNGAPYRPVRDQTWWAARAMRFLAALLVHLLVVAPGFVVFYFALFALGGNSTVSVLASLAAAAIVDVPFELLLRHVVAPARYMRFDVPNAMVHGPVHEPTVPYSEHFADAVVLPSPDADLPPPPYSPSEGASERTPLLGPGPANSTVN